MENHFYVCENAKSFSNLHNQNGKRNLFCKITSLCSSQSVHFRFIVTKIKKSYIIDIDSSITVYHNIFWQKCCKDIQKPKNVFIRYEKSSCQRFSSLVYVHTANETVTPEEYIAASNIVTVFVNYARRKNKCNSNMKDNAQKIDAIMVVI